MNSDFLRWLLNVKAIPKGSESLRLAWEHPWEAWLWALLALAAAAFALWSYSRMAGRPLGRYILAAARFLMLILLLVFISGPMLELPRETVERDWVLMLADRSASMTIKDAPVDDQRLTRDEQLHRALQSQADVIDSLAEQKRVVWLGFHTGAFNLGQSDGGTGILPAQGGEHGEDTRAPSNRLPNLGASSGRRTDINAAIEQALQRAAARPISGMVLFSDGRTDAPPTRALLTRLKAEKIPLYVVPLGSSDPVGDLAIRRIESPRRAFVRDKVPVIVEIEGRGYDAGAQQAKMNLIDQSTGELLDSNDIDLAELARGQAGDGLAVTFTAEPDLAGEATWVAVLETAQGQTDLIPENNSKSFQIELIDRPLRVLYIDGYPRWEYRYVKNLLVREKTIESSVMLVSADRDFAQEGNQPITRLPRSPEEFAAFDVIVLGDVPASFFSPQQLDMIRAHVADRGAGVLWMAGPRSLPSSYIGTALADLLPMRGSLKMPAIGEAVTMTTTPLAERLGVLQLALGGDETGWPAPLKDPQTGWSRLFYTQRIEPGLLKPAAEVLAETVNQYGGANLPLVISMRYGAGQSIFVATDEIWRWRYGLGELLYEQFWVQMIRTLGRESLISGGEPAIIEVNPRRVAVNQPMRIEVRLLDSQLVQTPRATIRVAIESDSAAPANRIELDLQRLEGTEDRFAATYLPDAPGQFRVRLDDSSIPNLRLQTPVEVYEPADELQKPQTDHDLLRQLAATTEGRVVPPDQLEELAMLPNRAVRTMNPLTEPIWDSPLALILALLALTFEWFGRKVLRYA